MWMKKNKWLLIAAAVILIQMAVIFYLLIPDTCKREEVSELQVQTTQLMSFTDIAYSADGLLEYEVYIHQSDVQVTMPFRTVIQQYHQGEWYDLKAKQRLSAAPVITYNSEGLNTYNWYDVNAVYGALTSGNYRMIKDVYIEKNGETQKYLVACEFEVK